MIDWFAICHEMNQTEYKHLQESTVCMDTIPMPPDWWNSKVTPGKVKWYIDKDMSTEQVAEKLQKIKKNNWKTIAKIDQLPEEKPIKEVPYGWKLSKDQYFPDEMEQ